MLSSFGKKVLSAKHPAWKIMQLYAPNSLSIPLPPAKAYNLIYAQVFPNLQATSESHTLILARNEQKLL